MKTALAIVAAILIAAAASASAPARANDGVLLGGMATGSVLGDMSAAAHGPYGYGHPASGYTSYGFGPGYHHPAYVHSHAYYSGAVPYHPRWNRYHW